MQTNSKIEVEVDIVSRATGFMCRISMSMEEMHEKQEWSNKKRDSLYNYFPVAIGSYDRESIKDNLDDGVPDLPYGNPYLW